MPRSDSTTLVSVKWLADHLAAPDVRVLDASWHLPDAGRDAKIEFASEHIPGAAFFDIDDIADERAGLPHTAPPMEKFVSRVRKLGVGDGHRIVIYDTVGMFSAARAWWMFRYFGHQDVAVLDGGLPKWKAGGLPVEDMPAVARERHFTPRVRSMMLKDVTEVSQAVKLGETEIVDARSPGRFAGAEPEPREGLRAGHIPGSKNVHYATLLNADGTMKDDADLKAVFIAAGVDLSKPIVTTCGSGVTAAILLLALERIGVRNAGLYDGSWAEWGASEMLPVETG
ncbi:MAG: 3-mercaptopyruvate sulfurtransferase [Pseudomonadota bacterium]